MQKGVKHYAPTMIRVTRRGVLPYALREKMAICRSTVPSETRSTFRLMLLHAEGPLRVVTKSFVFDSH